LGWKVRVQLTVEARNAKRHAWLENFRAPRGMASRRSALKKAQISRQESMKNALQEHPNNEIFGFVE